MARLELQFLGGMQLGLDGVPQVAYTSKKGQALICFLAITGIAHARSRLAGLLWSDRPEAAAQADLRKVISRLTPQLASHLLITRATLAFDQDSAYWLDVAEFEQAVADRARISHLIKAVTLYRGDFLDGFYIHDAPLFDEWLLAQRARLREVMLQALQTLTNHYLAGGLYERAATYTRRRLALEPWDESAHRDLMHLLALSGQRVAALAQFETARRVLAAELGVEPSPETLALYKHILSQAPVAPPGAHRTAAGPEVASNLPAFLQSDSEPARTEERPFVAREPELERLQRFLDQALTGRGQVALLIGEAGRGKTALMEAFVRQAQARVSNLVAVSGVANAYTDGGDPYLPFRMIASQLAGDIENAWLAGGMSREQARRLWETLPHTTEALLDIAPDLWDTFIPLRQHLARARAYAHGHETWLRGLEAVAATRRPELQAARQQRLFDQYVAVLQRLARRAPLLLVLDDLHWADAGSINLLFHLGRQINAHPMMILVAYRPVEVAVGHRGYRHPLQPIVSEFRRRFGDIVLDLGQWGDRRFVESFLDSRPNRFDATFRNVLFHRTRGHPLFTVELWQDLVERGDIFRDGSGVWMARPALDWRRLPARVEAVIGERVSRLPELLQRILHVASAEGETFTAEVVAHVLGATTPTIITHLSRELDRAHRLVKNECVRRLSSGRLSQYRFRHILIQDYLYNNQDESERAYLHEAIGRRLEEVYGSERHEIALQLARHFRLAGVADRAVMYLQQAGEQALRRSANAEAIAHYRHALALLETLPEGAERARQELDVQVALGAALQATGRDGSEAERTYQRAWELCQTAPDSIAIYPVLVGLWISNMLKADLTEAQTIGQRLLAFALTTNDHSVALGAHFTLGVSLYFLGEFEAAYAHLSQTTTLYDPDQHQYLMQHFSYEPGSMAYQYCALALWVLGNAGQAAEVSRRGIHLAREHGNPFNLANVLNYAALLHGYLGSIELAVSYGDEAEALATAHDLAQLLPFSMFVRGRALVLQDQYAAGLSLMSRGMAQWESSGARLAMVHYYCFLADSYCRVGDIDRAWEELEKGFNSVATGPYWHAELYRLRGELLILRDGADADIEAAFQQALDIAHRQRFRAMTLRVALSRGRWYAASGRRAEAVQLLAEASTVSVMDGDSVDARSAKALLEKLMRDQAHGGNPEDLSQALL